MVAVDKAMKTPRARNAIVRILPMSLIIPVVPCSASDHPHILPRVCLRCGELTLRAFGASQAMTPSRRKLNELRAAALGALRPVERKPLSEWIERNLYLPSGLSAVPGQIRLWNFQR